MKLSGPDYLYAAAALVVLYLAWRAVRAGDAAAAAVGRFYEGVTFDPASLGPAVTPTPGARMTEADYIAAGYLERLPDGRTRITPAGEQYIANQQIAAGLAGGGL